MLRHFIILALVNILFYSSAYPCSSFQLKTFENSFVGKNYDWTFGDALIIYNPSHLHKSSLSFSPTQKKIQWMSEYSSITFNQYGLDFPNGGMNEAGLTIEVLWLDASVYPAVDDKAVLNELQWIQYALDTQSTLQGVMKSFDQIRIEPVYAKVHYFVCDIAKNCATVEYVDGKMVFGTYNKLNFEAITNSTHQESETYLKKFKNFGGTEDIIWTGYSSLDRFVRLNEKLRTYAKSGIVDPITYAFSTLDAVKRDATQGESHTQWQIVHDKNNLVTYFKTTAGNMLEASVNLKNFPSECTNRYYFDISSYTRGSLNSEFKPLTLDVNYAHVKKTLRKVMPNAPEEMIKAISGAPFQFKCMN
jgi:penicillin V acylase-like amidase (Ntn superfamily)